MVYEAEGVSAEKITALFAALGGLGALLPVEVGNATVVLKPNFCLPDPPERATTTSPLVMELLCRYLIAGGVRRIIIADHTLNAGTAFDKHRLFDLPREFPEVKVVLANEERMYEPVEVKGKVLESVSSMKLLARADLLINLPAAKHHSATHVSLGVKNLMGVIWNRSDFHTKMDLAQAIGDLATVIRPALTIVDASRVLLTGGPTGPGKVVAGERLFASRDVVAVDAVVVSRYNFGDKSVSPMDVAHLRAAAANGVGELDLAKITVRKV